MSYRGDGSMTIWIDRLKADDEGAAGLLWDRSFDRRDEELKRDVALKRIRDERADDPHNRARFVFGAGITGGLEHPGIIPLYGLGQYDDGRPFYTMRFIKGDSFKRAIKRFHEAGGLDRDPGVRSNGTAAGQRPGK